MGVSLHYRGLLIIEDARPLHESVDNSLLSCRRQHLLRGCSKYKRKSVGLNSIISISRNVLAFHVQLTSKFPH